MTEHLTSAQVVEASGATYRQLDYWARNGAFGEQLEGRGSGHLREWPLNCIEAVMAMVDLNQFLASIAGNHGGVGASTEILYDTWRALMTKPVEDDEVLRISATDVRRVRMAWSSDKPYIVMPLRRHP